MTSEVSGAVSVQVGNPDSEVEKNSQPSPPHPHESVSFTSDVVSQSGTTETNECFYSDTLALYAPTNNSHQGDVPASPVISTLQIPPPGGSWSDLLHTCGYDCYQSPAKCPKRQAGSLDMSDRKHKYTKMDLGSGQIVERCGFGPGRSDGEETETKTDLGSSTVVERCGFGSGRTDGTETVTRKERGSRQASKGMTFRPN